MANLLVPEPWPVQPKYIYNVIGASSTKTCEVRISKKCKRGVKGSVNIKIPGFLNVDASSANRMKFDGQEGRFAFSPMHLGPVIEKDIFSNNANAVLEAKLFENYWQYGKVFPDMNHYTDQGITATWQQFRTKGYQRTRGDRHPQGTKTNEVKFVDNRGRNHYRYRTAVSSVYLNQFMDYITSRKLIYAPVYEYLVTRTSAFRALRQRVLNGEKVQIIEIDVPDDGQSHLVTVDLLRQRINDPTVPFGHGNVLAGLLCGISSKDYI